MGSSYVPHAAGYVDNGGPKLVTSRFGYEDSHTLARFEATGGYVGLKAALAKRPADVHGEVREATLLGRGGAGPVVAGADSLHEAERVAEAGDVEGGEERPHPIGVDVPGGLEQVGGLAVEHDADVDELLALHARDAAHDDVLVGQQLRHPRLPGARRARPDAR